MLFSVLCLLLLQLIPIFAAPLPSQRRVSLSLYKPYNRLNGDPIIFDGDSLLVSHSSKYGLNEWFTASFNSKLGSFQEKKQLLTISDDGQLKLGSDHVHEKSESGSQHDIAVQSHIFSIKRGIISFNERDTFSLCPLNSAELFSIHLSNSESLKACGNELIEGVKLQVQDLQGEPIPDFEAPEFIFDNGRHAYF